MYRKRVHTLNAFSEWELRNFWICRKFTMFTKSIYYYNHHIGDALTLSVLLTLDCARLFFFIYLKECLRIQVCANCEQSKSINKLCNFIWCTHFGSYAKFSNEWGEQWATEAYCRRRCRFSNESWGKGKSTEKKICSQKPKQCPNSPRRLNRNRNCLRFGKLSGKMSLKYISHTHSHSQTVRHRQTHAHYLEYRKPIRRLRMSLKVFALCRRRLLASQKCTYMRSLDVSKVCVFAVCEEHPEDTQPQTQ